MGVKLQYAEGIGYSVVPYQLRSVLGYSYMIQQADALT